MYFNTTIDGAGQPFAGARACAMRFAPGAQPFWSITMYDSTFNFTPNAINRYATGDRTPGFKRGADGGLTLYIRHIAGQGQRVELVAEPGKRIVYAGHADVPPGRGRYGAEMGASEEASQGIRVMLIGRDIVGSGSPQFRSTFGISEGVAAGGIRHRLMSSAKYRAISPFWVRPRDAVTWYEWCLSNADLSLGTHPSHTCELPRDPRGDLRGGHTEPKHSDLTCRDSSQR